MICSVCVVLVVVFLLPAGHHTLYMLDMLMQLLQLAPTSDGNGSGAGRGGGRGERNGGGGGGSGASQSGKDGKKDTGKYNDNGEYDEQTRRCFVQLFNFTISSSSSFSSFSSCPQSLLLCHLR
jgi:hypothetical protein